MILFFLLFTSILFFDTKFNGFCKISGKSGKSKTSMVPFKYPTKIFFDSSQKYKQEISLSVSA